MQEVRALRRSHQACEPVHDPTGRSLDDDIDDEGKDVA
jgi:hypothetical protein